MTGELTAFQRDAFQNLPEHGIEGFQVEEERGSRRHKKLGVLLSEQMAVRKQILREDEEVLMLLKMFLGLRR